MFSAAAVDYRERRLVYDSNLTTGGLIIGSISFTLGVRVGFRNNKRFEGHLYIFSGRHHPIYRSLAT